MEIERVQTGRARFDVRRAVARRRSEYEGNLTITPPAVVVGRFDPDNWVPDAAELVGLGASPGLATGPARVIL